MLNPDRIEIIPLPGIVDTVRDRVAPGTGVSVTSLPSHSLEQTVEVALELAAAGFDAIPHLAATRIGDPSMLDRALDRLDDSTVRSLFLVGGDGDRAGLPVRDGSALLNAVRERSGARFLLGVAAYPEGHADFDLDEGLRLLGLKAAVADYAVTQMCFDAAALSRFAERVPDAAPGMPIWFGVPGAVRMSSLLRIAARIGVGPSLAFARKGANRALLGRYDDRALREGVRALRESAGDHVAGVHLYTFNQLTSA